MHMNMLLQLLQVEKLIDDGYDVRGYFYWTLIDNFEWNFAWELKFGLYEWNDDGTQRRRLRDGAKVGSPARPHCDVLEGVRVALMENVVTHLSACWEYPTLNAVQPLNAAAFGNAVQFQGR